MKIGIPPYMSPRIKNLLNNVFGELIVVAYGGKSDHGDARWWCQCSCGNRTCVLAHNLKSGGTTSCGCRKNIGSPLHEMMDTSEYIAWKNAKARCYNKNHHSYIHYGARGILMHEKWKNSFLAFYEYIGPKPEPKENYSLDRINVDKNYCPGNVRWATNSEQQSNRQNRGETYLILKALQ